MEVAYVAEGEMAQKFISSLGRSTQSTIPYPCPLLKRFYIGSLYVVIGKVTALKMLWNVSLLYSKDSLYSVLTGQTGSLSFSVIIFVFLIVNVFLLL